MTSSRWVLGAIAALVAVGWTALAAGGSSFRRSFGASQNAAWMVVIPVVVALLVLASVVWPERRALMHLVAVLMVVLCIACGFLARETVFVASMGWVYALGWLAFYYRTVVKG